MYYRNTQELHIGGSRQRRASWVSRRTLDGFNTYVLIIIFSVKSFRVLEVHTLKLTSHLFYNKIIYMELLLSHCFEDA